ncbi:MAG: AsnC family transcriptional regulator [Candidatus Contendobacter sp.]|nr:AsnC family transcriptional regulator [Candidatus Contendobacter sp.]MDG4559228.1 AsnC family transcriptional regulator [Candidatus Contendobacter sp.]
MSDADLELLNRFQRDFPLTTYPFRVIAERLGWGENEVLEALRRLREEGKVSRVGAVFATRRLGVSTLAALAVPPERLEAVAQRVNAYPEINHNYQREHEFNLWFVLTAATVARLRAVLAEIEEDAGLPVLDLPLLEEFHIDLGFDLRNGGRAKSLAPTFSLMSGGEGKDRIDPDETDRSLLAGLQEGLPLVSRPYQFLARQLGLSEQTVLERLRHWLERGVIKRLGVVVRHRALGYRANAMVVWDIPDAEVSAVGRALAAEAGVNLCYRRPRRLPHWPYNLFCMMHGRQREQVLERIEQVRIDQGLTAYPCAALFSTRCFRQRGAYYLPIPVANPSPISSPLPPGEGLGVRASRQNGAGPLLLNVESVV